MSAQLTPKHHTAPPCGLSLAGDQQAISAQRSRRRRPHYHLSEDLPWVASVTFCEFFQPGHINIWTKWLLVTDSLKALLSKFLFSCYHCDGILNSHFGLMRAWYARFGHLTMSFETACLVHPQKVSLSSTIGLIIFPKALLRVIWSTLLFCSQRRWNQALVYDTSFIP